MKSSGGGSPEKLAQALDHAPVLAVLDVGRADWAMHTASACIAGGFSVLAVAANTPSASDLVRSLLPRHGLVVGAAHVADEAQARELLDAGASFVMTVDADPQVGALILEAGARWLPSAMTPNEVRRAASAGARSIVLYPAYSLEPRFLRWARLGLAEDVDLLAYGGLGGDTIGDWMAAGARAVCLSGALYSPELLGAGDFMAVRNYAAAAHQEATRHSRQVSRPGGPT